MVLGIKQTNASYVSPQHASKKEFFGSKKKAKEKKKKKKKKGRETELRMLLNKTAPKE